ncbi:T9SS type A sorting domain-containing protein [Prolixibacteraceae bacterium JC049]|nr:T9SS type A sorting domain-containing protein [Prolixibacteraceae bacterium JC049]
MRTFKPEVILVLLLLPMTLWAQNPYLSSSNLPIVVVATNESIKDDPKVNGTIGIIDNGESRNNLSDSFTFQSNIGIEIRGASSQNFPKKSYGFELRDKDNNDTDAPLLDMPEEEDWILHGPYSDKSLMRNVLTFTLAGMLDGYAPRCRYVELIINDDYRGVYVLMEKIKRDKNRVKISKLKEDDISGEDLTGGYIIKIDKKAGSGGDGFHSRFSNSNGSRSYYQYHYPKDDDITSEQKNYIQDWVYQFEKRVKSRDFNAETGYHAYVDKESFADYLIMNELAKNVDGYRLSTYFYKDKNEKLNLGPIWDFNLSYGNADYHNGWKEEGFQFEANLGNDHWQNPFYWGIICDDPLFKKAVGQRWKELRKNKFSNQKVFHLVDSLTTRLAEAKDRNFQRWNVLGKRVWPNYYVASTHAAEINWMKNWITERLAWLDENIPQKFNYGVGNTILANTNSIKLYPNPFQNQLNIQFIGNQNQKYRIELYNSQGVLSAVKEVFVQNGNVQLNLEHLKQGIYLYRIFNNYSLLKSGKLVKMK